MTDLPRTRTFGYVSRDGELLLADFYGLLGLVAIDVASEPLSPLSSEPLSPCLMYLVLRIATNSGICLGNSQFVNFQII